MQVGVVGGPLRGVGLGDAGDVAGGLGGVGDVHPLGDPALVLGIVASASAPIAASSPLHSAIACTVPMWFCTLRRLGMTSSAWFGSISVNRGWMVAKYGAFWPNSEREDSAGTGQRDRGALLPQGEDLAHAPDITAWVTSEQAPDTCQFRPLPSGLVARPVPTRPGDPRARLLRPGRPLGLARDLLAEVRLAERARHRLGLPVRAVQRQGRRPSWRAAGAVSGERDEAIGIATAATNHNTRHPLVTATFATTMHRLTGGRYALGLGRGFDRSST